MALEKAQKDSQDSAVRRFFFWGTKCCMLLLSSVEIVIGFVFLHQCPRQHFIPIYLVVNGVMVILMSLISTAARLRPNQIIHSLLGFFTFFWILLLITGSVWTFPHYHNYKGCHRTVYLFTFSNLIIQWIALAFCLRDNC